MVLVRNPFPGQVQVRTGLQEEHSQPLGRGEVTRAGRLGEAAATAHSLCRMSCSECVFSAFPCIKPAWPAALLQGELQLGQVANYVCVSASGRK